MPIAAYFGLIDGSPPGLPGGGITGVLPASGCRGAHFGIDAGGRAQHAVGLRELVAERLAFLAGGLAVGHGAGPPFSIGAQFAGRFGAGGAVCCAGVAGDGGACATAEPAEASNMKQ